MLVAGDITRPQNLQGSSDYFSIAPHGVANTHLDALCHIFRDGKMYNGFDQAEVTSVGARRNSIMSGKDGVVSRGVLLDIPALHGVPYLELGERITVEDLEAAEARQASPSPRAISCSSVSDATPAARSTATGRRASRGSPGSR